MPSRSRLRARPLARTKCLRCTFDCGSGLSRNWLARAARASGGSASASLRMSAALRIMARILAVATTGETDQEQHDPAVLEPLTVELLTPRGEPRQNAVVGAPIENGHVAEYDQDETRSSRVSLRSSGWTPAGCRSSSPVARAAFCAARQPSWSSTPVEPGREQPPCSCRVAVPEPVRGLLTPRLSRPLSEARLRRPSRSPRAVNRRFER